ncbi:MAG TPA: CopG family transcriptional regulator [Gemmatimonadaceae bacterium]|jgi:hypothetical protein|nr:CopG family transcriptional regulator [Gemmatimonadaceae bacterium]
MPMSKRLQVIIDDAEYRDLQKAARRRGLTVSQWVRDAIRSTRGLEPSTDAARKLAAVREAVRHAYPAPDVEQMLAEIERGYSSGAGE